MARLSTGWGIVVAMSFLAGCEKSPKEGILQVSVTGSDGAPVAGAIVAVDDGGVYQFGAVTGEGGSCTLLLPPGPKGVHVFAHGYYCSFGEDAIEPVLGEFQTIDLRADLIPPEAIPPVVSDLALNPSAARVGQEVEILADVSASSPDDPLSGELIVVEPQLGVAFLLNPPLYTVENALTRAVGGEPNPFPDGVWSQLVVAPDAPGLYAYYVAATSASCATGTLGPATLVVE